MATKYPTRKNTNFILAEEVRPEASKKLILLGVYSGGFIRVYKKPTDREPANLRLSFLFMFRDGEGEFNTKVQIMDPDGEELGTWDTGRVKKMPKSSLTVGFGLIGPNFKKLGTYKVIANLNDREYVFEFDIDFEEKPPESPAG